ncbi:unnamed protein product, partial [Prorocentrum cordatum]
PFWHRATCTAMLATRRPNPFARSTRPAKRLRAGPAVQSFSCGDADFQAIVSFLLSSGMMHLGPDMLRLGAASSHCRAAHWPLCCGGDAFEDIEFSQTVAMRLVGRLQVVARASSRTARSASSEQDSRDEEEAHRAAMTIISCFNAQNQKRLADAGALPALRSLAARSFSRSQASSAWALAKLCDRHYNNGFHSTASDHVSDAVELAIALLREGSLDVQGKGALLVAAYSANVDGFAVDVVLAGAVPYLESLLRENSCPHKYEALEAILRRARGGRQKEKAFSEGGRTSQKPSRLLRSALCRRGRR